MGCWEVQGNDPCWVFHSFPKAGIVLSCGEGQNTCNGSILGAGSPHVSEWWRLFRKFWVTLPAWKVWLELGLVVLVFVFLCGFCFQFHCCAECIEEEGKNIKGMMMVLLFCVLNFWIKLKKNKIRNILNQNYVQNWLIQELRLWN